MENLTQIEKETQYNLKIAQYEKELAQKLKIYTIRKTYLGLNLNLMLSIIM